MPEPEQAWTDQQVEQVVGNLLRIGVLAAAVTVLAGGILYLCHFGTNTVDYEHFTDSPPEPELRSPLKIIPAALELRSRGLIQLGLLLLIATPVARVIFSVYAFLRQHDRIYVVVTLIVLTVLLFSLLHGHL